MLHRLYSTQLPSHHRGLDDPVCAVQNSTQVLSATSASPDEFDGAVTMRETPNRESEHPRGS